MQGKYSPLCPHANEGYEFKYNAYGQIPTEWDNKMELDVHTMMYGFDSEGFDRYGYSCFDKEGNRTGLGEGVDRLGNTELDYWVMDEDKFLDLRWAVFIASKKEKV